MKRYMDLTNQRFGELKVVSLKGRAKNKTILWNCECSCGNHTIVRSNHLVHGHTKSCGCLQKCKVRLYAPAMLEGQRFGRLLVLKKLNKRKQRAVVWQCKCDCGAIVEVTTASLKSGHTLSCGCYHFDKIWKGGLSCEPYCKEWSFKEFKEVIKSRDGHKCLNPDCWQTDDLLVIHHIDYNKKNCELGNLVTVCRSCNTRANKDRSWHRDWYRAILSKKYGYIY